MKRQKTGEGRDVPNAIIFYGYIEDDTQNRSWSRAFTQAEHAIGEMVGDTLPPVALMRLVSGGYCLFVEASSLDALAGVPVGFDPKRLLAAPGEAWEALLIAAAIDYCIQLDGEEPDWYLTLI